MLSHDPFHPLPGRDAADAVRGFVYQANLTVEAWLALVPDCALELECGEDLDHVTHLAGEQHRRMDQAKDLAEPTSLASQRTLELLARVVQHADRNPRIRLSARLLTTSRCGREQGVRFPQDLPGIEAWTRFRSGGFTAAERAATLAAIRALLGRAKHTKPKAKARGARGREDGLRRLRELARSDGDLEGLIHRVEFCMGGPASDALRATIEATLLQRGQVSSGTDASRAYESLFVEVVRRIADRRRQPLTTTDRDAVLARARSGATSPFAELWSRLAAVMGELGKTVAEHGSRLDRIEDELKVFGTAPTVRLGNPVGPAEVAPAEAQPEGPAVGPPLDGRPPAPLPEEVRRPSAEASVSSALEARACVFVVGISGAGKTVLARRALSTPEQFWVRLRDLTPEGASHRIRTALRQLTGGHPPRPSIPNRVPPGLVLVLDDLPRLDGADELSELILELVDGAGGARGKLLCVTPFSPGARFAQRVANAQYAVLTAPPLDDSEAAEFLAALEAPAEWLQRAGALNKACGGHPEHFVASARQLRLEGWRSDADLHLQPLDKDVRRRLRSTVTSTDALDLLFRLCIPNGWFEEALVARLAEVREPICFPDVVASDLEGLWLQKSDGGLVAVAPVVRFTAVSALGPEKLRRVHAAVGEYLLSRPMGLTETGEAVHHLHEAGDADRAAFVLCSGLHAVRERRAWSAGPTLLGTWRTIPPAVSPGLAALVRANQIGTGVQCGVDVRILVDDLRGRLARLPIDDPLRGSVVSAILLTTVIRAPDVALDLVAAPDAARLGSGESWCQGTAAQLVVALGVHASWLDLRRWLAMLESLPESLVSELREMADLVGATVGITETLWLGLRADPGRGSAVIDLLERTSSALSLPILGVAAVRLRLMVRAEILRELDGAATEASSALARMTSSTERFLVAECVGRQLVYGGRLEDGLTWLRRAFGHGEDPQVELVRFHALLVACAAAQTQDPDRADGYAAAAVVIARRGQRDLDLARALGERSLAAWRRGDSASGFEYLYEATRLLLAHDEADESWCDLLVAAGQLTASAISRGGSGLLGPPLSPGFFLPQAEGRQPTVDHPPELLKATLASAVSMLAERWGRHDDQAAWVEQAALHALRGGAVGFAAHSRSQIVHWLLVSGRTAEAFQAVRGGVRALVSVRRTEPRGSLFTAGLDLVGDEEADLASSWMAGAFLVPAFAKLVIDRSSGHDVTGAAATLAELCESEGTERWCTAARLVRAALLGGPTLELAEVRDGCQKAGENDLALLAMLALATRPEVSPAAAFLDHLSFGFNSESRKGAYGTSYERLVVPAIVADWRNRVGRQSISMRAPRILRAALDVAYPSPSATVRRVLAAAAEAVGVALARETAQWLYAAPA